MKVDLYTKIVLTVIALALTFNLLKPILSPADVEAKGGGKFDGTQISVSMGGVAFFDTKTGDVWVYDKGLESSAKRATILELGKPAKSYE